MTFQDVLEELGKLAKSATHAQTGLWVSSALRERIAAGQLAPGTKLSEEVLCDVLGVSRNTLREAFTTLSSEHIITRIPNRGVFVSHPTAEDIREIYRVRRYLEPAALIWSPASNAAELERIVDRARSALESGSIPRMAAANQDFHCAVAAQTGSERLNSLMAQVLAEMRLVFHGMAANPDFHAPYVEDNAHIAALLRAGKRQEAADFMTSYLDRAEAQLLAAIDGSGKQPMRSMGLGSRHPVQIASSSDRGRALQDC